METETLKSTHRHRSIAHKNTVYPKNTGQVSIRLISDDILKRLAHKHKLYSMHCYMPCRFIGKRRGPVLLFCFFFLNWSN